MSHFTCLVIEDDPEEALAPYDENMPVEPYKAYWDSDDYERWEGVLQQKTGERRNPETKEVETFEYQPDEVLGEEYTLEDMRRVYMRRFYDWDPPAADASTKDTLEELGFEVDEDPGVDDKLHIDDGGIYEWSTYNPKSKWDWWQVGGRWRGFFKLKETAREMAIVGDPGAIHENKPRFDADVAIKGDVDIEWMRDEAGRVAGETWDRVHEVIGNLPEALSWEEFVGKVKLAEVGESAYTIAQAREDYHAQERVIALKEWNDSLPDGEKVIGWFGPSVEDFQYERDEFVQRARDEVLCPYAYIYEGEWHAPGKMGWFGNSSDNASDRVRFAREFNELLDSLPDDTLLTLCDLHI